MNLKIRLGTVRYNNKILVSDEKFGLGKNDKVNAPAMKSHKVTQQLTHNEEPQTITHISHNDEKIALVLFLASGLQYGICFDESSIKKREKTFLYGSPTEVFIIIALTTCQLV